MGHEIHRGEHDRMLYAQQPGYGIADRHEVAPRAVFGLDSILKPSYHFRKMIRFDDCVLYSRTVLRWSYPIFRPLRRLRAAGALHPPPGSFITTRPTAPITHAPPRMEAGYPPFGRQPPG